MNRKIAIKTLAGAALAFMPTMLAAQTAPAPLPVTAPVEPKLAAAPKVTIRNGLLTATIYTPAAGAFYMGTRFDRSGVVGSLKLGAQEYYGAWFQRTGTDIRDFIHTPDGIAAGPNTATMGPVEEFGAIGYDATPVGGQFLKIGVGMVTRPDAQPYSAFRLYQVADPGRWAISSTADSVTMTQTVVGGSGYVYTKTLRLVPGKPQMVIEHVLRNTSGQAIATNVYNHNFVTMDPGNGNTAVDLAFEPAPPPRPSLTVTGKRITWTNPLVDKDSASMLTNDEKTPPKTYDVTVTNLKTGAAIKVVSAEPMTRMNLWSIRTVNAAEPYVAVNVPAGGETRWSYTYTYTAPHS
jgi:hypothetical protein